MSLLGGAKFLEDGFINADHVVIFSGGCDSTLLLKEVAAQHATTDKPVVALSIDHYLIDGNKREQETKKREEIIAELRRRKMRVEQYTIKIDGDANVYTSSAGPIQSYFWLTSVAPYIKKGAKVYIGYIRSDDALVSLQGIYSFKNAICSYLDKDFDLEIPYMSFSKEDIISELMNCDLYNKTWYCEMPKDEKPCGYCVPCKTHQRAIITLATEGHERAITMLPPHIKIIKKHLPKNRKVLLK